MTTVTLVLVCKKPALGSGKQRLAAKLGPVLALAIAEALLACALEDVVAWPGPIVIAPANAIDLSWAKNLIEASASQHPLIIIPQSAGNLGQRLNQLDRSLRAQHHQALIFIGSDAPSLCAVDYDAVTTALNSADMVLIPARDGGVVLMANRHPWPDLTLLPWSSDRLGIQLRDACESSGLLVRQIGQGYDVDEVRDVLDLVVTLQHDVRPARRALRALVIANLNKIQAVDI